MDALSVTANVLAVLQAANTVINICYDYSSTMKSSGQADKVLLEIKNIRAVLETLAELARRGEGEKDLAAIARLPTLTLLCDPYGGPLAICLAELQTLEKKLTLSWAGKIGSKRRAMISALTWPLNEGETNKMLASIGRSRDILQLGLTAEHTKLMIAIQASAAETQIDLFKLNQSISAMKTDVERERIYRWLAGQDPSTNFYKARERHQAMTGSWLIKSRQFSTWIESPSSFLWLHGISGCGKTILCSTVIEHAMRYCLPHSQKGVAYFFFDFNDPQKQRHGIMIRTLITQLASYCPTIPEPLKLLFESCVNGLREPPNSALMATLKAILESFTEAFIVLDALDECTEREELLADIKEIVEWKTGNLHILVASRREVDIEEALEVLISKEEILCVQSQAASNDIRIYVQQRLRTDQKLLRWEIYPDVQNEIEAVLTSKAHGMFRWVVCQMDALRNCLNLPMLRKSLANLPKNLDDTYARILCSIEEEHKEHALHILQWLVSSTRPLTIEEVAEVIAIDVTTEPMFDAERRFLDKRDILQVCSSLVTTVEVVKESAMGRETYTELRLAHFSVKEYLLSKRVQSGPASWYSITESDSNVYIGEACLAYLLHFDEPEFFSSNGMDEFPLARYASKYWFHHARYATKDTSTINDLTTELLVSGKHAYENMIWLYDPDSQRQESTVAKRSKPTPSPLYYVSHTGLIEVAALLLAKSADVNASGGQCGSALEAAAAWGNEDIVKLLLKEGANVDFLGGFYGCALQAAAAKGFVRIVDFLLTAGAHVNSQGGEYGNSLQAASFEGHHLIVEKLLAYGADVNAERGRYGNALLAAASEGHAKVVKQLLVAEADPNADGGFFGRALHEASGRGHTKVVELLLEYGAEVNGVAGDRDALQAAAFEGQHQIVELLLQGGADINAQGGYYATALQAASSGGSARVIELLLAAGANVNCVGGTFGNALQAGVYKGHKRVVELLLLHGADPKMRGRYGNALQVAIFRGHDQIADMLRASLLLDA